ncbi:hypothetical protein [Curtobacterium sp. KT1]|uniref:hypothetical protein n=1 Tax=Curtobacterium sp. KT1 TaxID=3372858 RepID=UPI0037BEDB37
MHLPASLMLRFYSVECGLKAALAKREDLVSIADEPRYITHDLRVLLKELNVPATHADALDNRRAIDAFGGIIALRSIHEAWRYGRTLHGDDNKEAGDALDALHDWCKEEL